MSGNTPTEHYRDGRAVEQELQDEFAELRELRRTRSLLRAENERLKHTLDLLPDELKGLDLTAKATQENIDFYDRRRGKSVQNVAQLVAKREALEQEVTHMHLKIKAADIEARASVRVNETLDDDLAEIMRQKKNVSRRLKDIQLGLGEISDNRQRRLPHLRWYDTALKQIRSTFVETQNKMEVALLMKRKEGPPDK